MKFSISTKLAIVLSSSLAGLGLSFFIYEFIAGGSSYLTYCGTATVSAIILLTNAANLMVAQSINCMSQHTHRVTAIVTSGLSLLVPYVWVHELAQHILETLM